MRCANVCVDWIGWIKLRKMSEVGAFMMAHDISGHGNAAEPTHDK
jgi:hypothetical protein